MSSIKDTVKENLVSLRKQNKLTQLELSQKINYSDKAISRWETGEVTPDVETLAALAELYEVPISIFFLPPEQNLSKKEMRAQKSAEKAERKRRLKETRESMPLSEDKLFLPRRIAYLIFNLTFLWATVLCLFFLLQSTDITGGWRVFIWGAVASVFLILVFFWQGRSRVPRLVFGSIFLWALIAAIYLQISLWHLFPIFFIGCPMQVIILLLPALRKPKEK